MGLVFRVLTALALLLLLASQLDLTESLKLATNAKLVWIGVALGLLLILRMLASVRWYAVLRHHKHSVSLIEIIEITFISTSIGHLLPSGVGGDVVRGVQLSHRHGQVTSTASTILIDRFIGIYSMLLVALIGAAIAPAVITNSQLSDLDLFWPLLSLNIVFIACWLASGAVHSVLSSASITVPAKLQRLYGSLLQVLGTLSNRQSLYPLLPSIMSLSLLTQLARCAMFYSLYMAFSVELPFIVFIAFIPLVFVVMQIPLSIGGLGLREGALIYFFGMLTIPAEISANVGIISHGLQLVIALPGLLLWLWQRK